jgi:CTD nuclear envelope phosphatase 1
MRNGNFLKDLTLAEKDLCKVCLVDNSPIAFDLYKGWFFLGVTGFWGKK